jgi:hypothetical protein
MRILLFFILATFYCLNADAQDSHNARGFAIGVSISPDVNYRTLKNNDGSFSSGVVVDVRNDNETYKLGYTTGLNIVYRFTDKFEIESGLLFSNKGYRGRKTELTYGSQWNGSGFNDSVPAGLPSSAQFSYSYYYIDVPLKASYSFGNKRLRGCIGAGVTLNNFINEKVSWKLWYPDGTTEKDHHGSEFAYNGLSLSPLISAGINYRVNDKLNLKVEPTVRYGILNIINTPVTGYLWNVGLNAGLYLKL